VRRPLDVRAIRIATHRLARRLSGVSGLPAVGELVVRSAADLLGARVATLAVPDPDGRRLTIVATEGYPLALVSHLKILPGSGILGRVFQSRRPLRVEDVSKIPGLQRRPRYRTNSLMALPIRAGQDIAGVLSLSDRCDGVPFTSQDMSAARSLAASTAIALTRERVRLQAESLAHAAAIDPVSGLFNRRYFHVRIDEELQRAQRHNMPLGLLMIDLDDFKQVNDTYGHLVGDMVIRETAEIIRRSVRLFDVCTRFGGEEFAIVMPGSGTESAGAVAERIRQRIQAYRSADIEGLRITASVGVAVSLHEMSVQDLISSADQALYLAKRAGKNIVRTTGEFGEADAAEVS